MAYYKNLVVEGPDFKATIPETIRGMKTAIKNVTRKVSDLMVSAVRNEGLMGGTTATRLAVKSGNLVNSIKPITNVVWDENTFVAGFEIKVPGKYGPHFANDNGSQKITVITPKKGTYLAIPLSAVNKQILGDKRIPSVYPGLKFISKGRQGKDPLLAYSSRGIFIPMFVLKRSVTIKSRVNIKEILDRRMDEIYNMYETAVEEVMYKD